MSRVWQVTALVVLSATGVLFAQQGQGRSRDQAQLESAINVEMIDGDLKKALDIYRSIADSSDRAVAAEARLRLGQGYRRLGDPRAEQTLQRVLEFPEQQRPVAAAKALLAATSDRKTGRAPAARTVLVDSFETNVEFAAISLDGRLLAYTDYTRANANLMVRDLTTGLDRQLTSDGRAREREVLEKSVSRDGRRIAYAFNWNELRVVDVAGDKSAAPRVVFTGESVRSVAPYDWSADGARIAAQVGYRDRSSRLGYITLADGVFHPIRSLDWRGSSRLSLSPDGAWLAYDRPTEDGTGSDVYVVSTDGKQEMVVATRSGRSVVVGWSPDGRRLIFARTSSGETALLSRPMRNGRPSGPAVVEHPRFPGSAIGITADGDIYVDVRPGPSGFTLAAVDIRDVKAGASSTTPIPARSAEWAPDGKTIAYLGTDRLTITLQTVATGKTRELAIKGMAYVQGIKWSPDGRSFLGGGADVRSRPSQVRIDATTGETTTLFLRPEFASLSNHQWVGPSSMGFVSMRTTTPGMFPMVRSKGEDAPAFIERDLESGAEKVRFRFTQDPWATFAAMLSPDRRFIASRTLSFGEVGAKIAYADDRTSYILIGSLETGESRRLWTAPFPNAFAGPIDWLPDGSAVIVGRFAEEKVRRIDLWLVPVNGGAPRKLDTAVSNLLPGSRLSPDGRRIALMTGDNRGREIRVFDRILSGR